MKYPIRHADASNDLPGTMTIDADDDQDAIRQTRAMVAAGFSGEAWASVALPDGRCYVARNVRGEAVGHHLPA